MFLNCILALPHFKTGLIVLISIWAHTMPFSWEWMWSNKIPDNANEDQNHRRSHYVQYSTFFSRRNSKEMFMISVRRETPLSTKGCAVGLKNYFVVRKLTPFSQHFDGNLWKIRAEKSYNLFRAQLVAFVRARLLRMSTPRTVFTAYLAMEKVEQRCSLFDWRNTGMMTKVLWLFVTNIFSFPVWLFAMWYEVSDIF